MKVLFLTPKSPIPPTDGGSLRNFHILKRVARRYEVTLITFGDERICPESQELADLGVRVIWVRPVHSGMVEKLLTVVKGYLALRPYTIQKYIDAAYLEAVQAQVATGTYDLVHIGSVHLHPYAAACQGLPVVMDQHNVEALIWTRTRQLERRWVVRAFLRTQEILMDRFEQRARRSVDLVLAVSNEDAAIMRGANLRSAPIVIVPNGVDTDFFTGTPYDERTSGTVVFVGAMDWKPNVDGVLYFAEKVFSRVQSTCPGVRFYIVGKNPPPEVRALASDRITVTGMVPDVRLYYRMAEAVVVPLRIGGGTRLKILEALSMGQALVSTAVGAEGLNLQPGSAYLQADDPAAFADAVISLLQSPARRAELGQSGQEAVRAQYGWDSVCVPLWAGYGDMAGSAD